MARQLTQAIGTAGRLAALRESLGDASSPSEGPAASLGTPIRRHGNLRRIDGLQFAAGRSENSCRPAEGLAQDESSTVVEG